MSLLYVAQLKKENDFLKELCKDSYKLLLRKLKEIQKLRASNQELLNSESELLHAIFFLKRENKFPDFPDFCEFDKLSDQTQELILS